MQQLVRLQRQITKYIRQVKRYLNLIHRFQKRRGGSNGQHPRRRRHRIPNPKQHNPKNHPVGTNHLVESTEKEEIPVIVAQPQEEEATKETEVVVIQEPPSKD